MTETRDLPSLIARLEASSGASGAMNAEIGLALGYYSAWKSKRNYWNVEGPNGRVTVPGREPDAVFDSATGERLEPEVMPLLDICYALDLPDWTGSIDAAIALVDSQAEHTGTYATDALKNALTRLAITGLDHTKPAAPQLAKWVVVGVLRAVDGA
jgi:hypothetical protein